MGNNSVPKFIFRLSRFPVYRGSVLGRFYCIIFKLSPHFTLSTDLFSGVYKPKCYNVLLFFCTFDKPHSHSCVFNWFSRVSRLNTRCNAPARSLLFSQSVNCQRISFRCRHYPKQLVFRNVIGLFGYQMQTSRVRVAMYGWADHHTNHPRALILYVAFPAPRPVHYFIIDLL